MFISNNREQMLTLQWPTHIIIISRSDPAQSGAVIVNRARIFQLLWYILIRLISKTRLKFVPSLNSAECVRLSLGKMFTTIFFYYYSYAERASDICRDQTYPTRHVTDLPRSVRLSDRLDTILSVDYARKGQLSRLPPYGR